MATSQARPGTAAPRVSGVLQEVRRRGLLDGPKTSPTGGRINAALLEEAKRVSGIAGTTDLLTYALAKVAVEDSFAEDLLALEGSVPPGTFVAD